MRHWGVWVGRGYAKNCNETGLVGVLKGTKMEKESLEQTLKKIGLNMLRFYLQFLVAFSKESIIW